MQTPPSVDEIDFSVVIPTFNRAALVARAVRSALLQTKQPAEVIVVDDGSTDDTRERLRAFDERVRYIYQENAGAPAARNRGFQEARHPWVALQDSDDEWSDTHLERVATAIVGTGGAANYYFADTLEPPDKGRQRLWALLDFDVVGPYELAEDGTAWALMPRQPMMLQSSVFKKAAFAAAGGFLPALRYRDDTHLFLKLALGQPVCAVAGCGAIMSSDDDPHNRLTLTHDRQERGTQMQVIMNRDLLATASDLPPATRQVLRERLGNAHRALARSAWRRRRYDTAVIEAARSALVEPGLFLSRVFARFNGVQ